MRVLVAAASFSANISGLQRHAFNLAQCLLSAPEVERVHFVVAPWQQEMAGASGLQFDSRFILHAAKMDRSPIGRNGWYYRKLPDLARAVRADVVHLSYPMPVDASALRCPTVVSLHDLYPYEIPMNFGFPKFIFNRLALRECLSAVDAIACVSDATANKLRKYMPACSGKAVRIYNCVEPQAEECVFRPWEWGDGPRGHLKAIDPLTGKAKWEAPSDIPRFSGVLSTAGGIVFSGQLTGEFEAFDADTGKKLWQFQTGSGIEGQPVTWQQDGVQYVAVTSGYGGVYSLFSGDERLAKVPPGGSLWVFAVKQ